MTALDAALPYLRCPHCGSALAPAAGSVRCPAGHSFDIARQGYVSLLAGARAHAGDSAEMVAARERFLAAGHYSALEDAVAEACALAAAGVEGCIAELGAGTGRYLARALDGLPERIGIALDVSAPALRRAARAHPRMAAVGADVWAGLPLRDASAAAVLAVFSPRSGPEIARVLAPGGAFVVAAPTDRHLAELVGPLGMLTVDPRKRERLSEGLGDVLAVEHERTVELPLTLDRADAGALVRMGPSARHVDAGRAAATLEQLPEPLAATASVTVSIHRRRA